jgi:alpha-1,6-mannosyltransferase
MSRTLLVGSGLGLVGACVALSRIENLVEAPRAFLLLFFVAFACYGALLWTLGRYRGRSAFLFMLIVAGLARLVLLFTPPTLSTDAYRYVWDARVASAGISPYAAPPTAPELADLRDAVVYPRLNHPTWRTVYPPGAQLFFRAVYTLAPDSVIAMKAAMALAELATLGVLASLLRTLGVPLVQLAVYALNPLVLVEIWSSGHLDALALLLVVTALHLATSGRVHLAAAVLGVGTLIKLYPALLLPLLVTNGAVMPVAAFAVVVLAGYAPFAHLGLGALGSLFQYTTTEYFNIGVLRTVFATPIITIVALAAWVVVAALRRRATASMVDRAFVLLAGVVLLSPNLFPWYVLWLVPLLALSPFVPWIAFTGTVALAYTFFLHEPWAIPAWARTVEFLPLAAGAVWAAARRWSADRFGVPECLSSRPLGGGQP